MAGSGRGYKRAPGDTLVVTKCSVSSLYKSQYPGYDTVMQFYEILLRGKLVHGLPLVLFLIVAYEDTIISKFFLKIQWTKKVFQQQISELIILGQRRQTDSFLQITSFPDVDLPDVGQSSAHVTTSPGSHSSKEVGL